MNPNLPEHLLSRGTFYWAVVVRIFAVFIGCLLLAPLGNANTPITQWQPKPLPALAASGSFAKEEQQLLQSLLADATPTQKIRLLLLLNQPHAALRTLQQWRASQLQLRANASPYALMPYELWARALLTQGAPESALPLVFQKLIGSLPDPQAHLATAFIARDPAQNLEPLQQLHQQLLEAATAKTVTSVVDLKNKAELQRRYFSAYAEYYLLAKVQQQLAPLVEADRNRRYHIDTKVLITTSDGIELSAIVVRSKSHSEPRPAILSASIYADEAANLQHAIAAAARGYVGVVSDSRGKRLSQARITPYENETKDVTAMIDWLSRQPWCDGRVAMYGGSYLGYTQWAAAKNLPKALKTIVPAAAAIPGQGLPMENNIFLNANYAWPFFVSNGRYNDPQAYIAHNDHEVNQRWYQSGRAYRDFDQIAGKANPWLQKWLQHPSFDEYWQSMVPTAAEYQKLAIPVLSLTGYYDDGQISALQYVRDHQRYNPEAEHYLVIGPYDHFGAQHGSNDVLLREYPLDQVAHLDVLALTFSWFDYVLKGQPKPALLQDKINYQLMDDNSWRHAPSLAALAFAPQRFYFAAKNPLGGYGLTVVKPALDSVAKNAAIATQRIDFKDRSQSYNQHYYPWPLLQPAFVPDNGLLLQTEPLLEAMELAGTFSASLQLRLNKKDVDLGLTLFEVTPQGQYFNLSYLLGRASYAKDPSQRQLLQPGKPQTVVFQRSRMIGKKIAKGSRLLLLANVNLNAFAQINYGSGGDVSAESIADAGEALQLEWLAGSFIELPLRPFAQSTSALQP